jgi:rod shape determining protein RodA
MMLLDPESDPLGAGYHIIQSKIAIGSGGLGVKAGCMVPSHSWNSLPERHTDFIFAVLAEELGLVGVLVLLGAVSANHYARSDDCRKSANHLRPRHGGGVDADFVRLCFVNIGMVSGILPVVGVPLPLVSYGGSALIVLMAGFGIVMSIHTHQKNVV